jgi:hypothetical protein
MASPTFRGRDCSDLLVFEEVRRRLGLTTRLSVGRREVSIADIVGSVDRAADFDGCFRPRTAPLRKQIQERSANAAVLDQPISLIQVDHAYFVEDGHKRLSLAIAAGRREVDADVDRYETDLHLAPGTTIDQVRATQRERRFRETTGLDLALPGHRFGLSDPAGYLELEESVKAHTLDLSYSEGRLVSREDGAGHWYETVFAPVLEIAASTSRSRLLESTSPGDQFLLFRRGIEVPMEHGWRITPAAIERGRANLADQAGGRRPRVRIPGRNRPPPATLLDEEPRNERVDDRRA